MYKSSALKNSGNQFVNWILQDAKGASGYYQVLINDTPVGNWNVWTNNTQVPIVINTSTLGNWKYTIEFNESVGLYVISDDVIIIIVAEIPTTTEPETTDDRTTAPSVTSGLSFLIAFITLLGVFPLRKIKKRK